MQVPQPALRLGPPCAAEDTATEVWGPQRNSSGAWGKATGVEPSPEVGPTDDLWGHRSHEKAQALLGNAGPSGQPGCSKRSPGR